MYTARYIRLMIGLVLYAIGIVLMINADLGLAPWEAFHIGLSQVTGQSFGMVSIIVGFMIIAITYQLKESIGIGTIASNFFVGLLVDLLFFIDLIPMANNTFNGVVMILSGMVAIAVASYFYIGSAFGTGPRDGLMVALTREYNKPIGLVRGSIELSVLVLGYLLGAKIGIGTILIGFGIGPVVQVVFKLLKFEVKDIEHTAFLQKRAT